MIKLSVTFYLRLLRTTVPDDPDDPTAPTDFTSFLPVQILLNFVRYFLFYKFSCEMMLKTSNCRSRTSYVYRCDFPFCENLFHFSRQTLSIFMTFLYFNITAFSKTCKHKLVNLFIFQEQTYD